MKAPKRKKKNSYDKPRCQDECVVAYYIEGKPYCGVCKNYINQLKLF